MIIRITETKFIQHACFVLVFFLFTTGYAQAENQTHEYNFISSGRVGTSSALSSDLNKIEPSSGEDDVKVDKNFPSLLFTYWEHTAIRDAKNSIGLVRAPSEEELRRELSKGTKEQARKVKPADRDVTLGGIVFHGGDDWTIWLNGKRVTPEALPPEAIDLKVSKEFIEMKWFDEYTNQIFPIRLRAHQRFNIDTRIFLPG